MLVLPVVANQSAAGLHACVYGKENVYALAFYVGDRDPAAVVKELKALGHAFVESARPKTRVGERLKRGALLSKPDDSKFARSTFRKLGRHVIYPVRKSTSVSFSAMTRPSWLGRAVRNRHHHAIEQASRRWRTRRKFDSHTELDAYEAMTSRMGVPRFTRMTVISPVFLLCARTVIMPSSPVRRSTGESGSCARAGVAPMASRAHFDLLSSGPRRQTTAPTRTAVSTSSPCSSRSSCCHLLVLSLA